MAEIDRDVLHRYLMGNPTDDDITVAEPVVRAYLIERGELPTGCSGAADEVSDWLNDHFNQARRILYELTAS